MRSLRTQLSVSMMLVILLTVAIISLLSNLMINREFDRYMEEQQREKADGIVSLFHNQYNASTREWNEDYIHGAGMYALHDGYIIRLYDSGGGVVWDAENHDMATCHEVMAKIAESMKERRPKIGGEFVTRHYKLTMEGLEIGSMDIRYYGPYFLSESGFRYLDTLNSILAVIGVFSLLLALLISNVLSRRIARPITKTAYIAKQIAEGNYAVRFEGKTKSNELDELVAAVNHLAAGLAEQENLRKRLTVDVAHELRTPLTTLSSHLEAMIEGVWEPSRKRLQSCHEEIGRLSGLAADLEQLAKTESDNLVLNKTRVDLMEIARTGRDNFEMEIRKKNLSLAIEGNSSVVYADRDRLSQVVANLLSNAVKYTPENGHIRIMVRDSERKGILIIEDDGIGVPEEERTLIFQRFYRTDMSRNRNTGGAGIGLAIVKSILTAHGGTIEAENRAEHGSRFTVTLPK